VADTRLWLDFPFLLRTGPSQRAVDASRTCTVPVYLPRPVFSQLLSLLSSHILPPPNTQPDTLTELPNSPRPRPSRASVMTNMSTTSYTPRHSRTTSPPLSVATPSTVGPQTQRLNVVTRLTVEGNAKRVENVPIKMYMKVCHPLSITPTPLVYFLP
jgi:hypothetical protein